MHHCDDKRRRDMLVVPDYNNTRSSPKQLLLWTFLLVILMMAQSASALTALASSSTPKQPLLVSEDSMEIAYDKLAERLRSKIVWKGNEGAQPQKPQQYWVAIAGGPGSGKTTTATQVAKRLNQVHANHHHHNSNDDHPKKVICVVLPMDGFHYPKDKLKEMDPPDGHNYLLRRGAPWTMDATLCHQLLRQAKLAGKGELPSYSREISDPVPGCVVLEAHHQIVLVEGLYLLLAHHPEWQPLQALWDESWFVRCPSRHQQRERLIARSLENWSDLKIQTWGPGRPGAERKVDANDVLNMDIVAASEAFCDVVIESK